MSDNVKAAILTIVLGSLLYYGYRRYKANRDQEVVNELKQREISEASAQMTTAN